MLSCLLNGDSNAEESEPVYESSWKYVIKALITLLYLIVTKTKNNNSCFHNSRDSS